MFYDFECRACGAKPIEAYLPVSDCTNRRKFPKCEKCRSRRNVFRLFGVGSVARAEKKFSYWSSAMGVIHDSERIPGEVYNAKNELRVDGPAHRRKLMKKMRMIEAV